MRARTISRPLSVQTMPGTHAALLGLGMGEDSCAGPLSDDPTVVGEPANLSPLDNRVVIHGGAYVADIYLGGFILSSHHAFHESANQKWSPTIGHSCADDWWKIQCGDTSRPQRRVYFSGTPA